MSSAVPCSLGFTSPRSRRHSLPLASAQARILYEPAPHPKMYTDICQLSGIWMDGWMTDSLPPSQRAGLYIYTLRVCLCVCVLQMDNKTFLSTLFPNSEITCTVPIQAVTVTVCKVPKHFYLLFFHSIFIFFLLFLNILWSFQLVACLFNLSHCRFIFGLSLK